MIKKYLIKTNTSIKTLENSNNLKDTDLTDELVIGDFIEEGFDDLSPLLEEQNDRTFNMDYQSDEEDGKIYKISMNRVDLPVIKKLEII